LSSPLPCHPSKHPVSWGEGRELDGIAGEHGLFLCGSLTTACLYFPVSLSWET
jgi:hypothetical protein